MVKKSKIKVDHDKKVPIFKSSKVKVTEAGNITKVTYSSRQNYEPSIKKLNKDEYVTLGTGEIKKFNHDAENRFDNDVSMKKTLSKLRDLINFNFVGGINEIFVTLTYKEVMNDTNQLAKDRKRFFRKLRNETGLELSYIAVTEMQARGSFHEHLLLKIPSGKLYIEHEKIANIWGHGFVFVNRIKADNIGAYLSAYLSDLPVDELKDVDKDKLTKGQIVDRKMEDGTTKKYVKGQRLKLLPKGFNYFTKSSDLKYPDTVVQEYGELDRSKLGRLDFESSTVIKDENDRSLIAYKTEFYNKKRAKKKSEK